MTSETFEQHVPGGVVHKLPADLREALIANTTALAAWKGITPLARNEFICWVEDAKQEMTRGRRIRRTQEELVEGQRRPCCWPGCKHRERSGRQRPEACPRSGTGAEDLERRVGSGVAARDQIRFSDLWDEQFVAASAEIGRHSLPMEDQG
jgi:hypothetical protein